MTPINYGVAILRRAHPGDAADLAPRLRRADLAEIAAGGMGTPLEALLLGVRSGTCYAIVDPQLGTQVYGMFGVVPLPGNPEVGLVWLLGSDELTRISYHFLRNSREWLARLSAPYKLLCNCIDSRNTVHIRWLRWLGFTFLNPQPRGVHGETFIEFLKINPKTP